MLEPPAHAVRCLKEWGPRSVWLVHRPGEGPRTLKRWPVSPYLLLKMLTGRSQAHRQARGAGLVDRAGVRTPKPVGSWRLERVGGRWHVRVELEFVEGRSAYELARADGIDQRFGRRCAGLVGAVVRALWAAGVVHKDLKLENLVVAGGDGDPQIWVLDLVGVRSTRHPAAAIVRMLDRLYVSVADRAVPRWQRVPLVREALRGLPREKRREVVRRLRAIRY